LSVANIGTMAISVNQENVLDRWQLMGWYYCDSYISISVEFEHCFGLREMWSIKLTKQHETQLSYRRHICTHVQLSNLESFFTSFFHRNLIANSIIRIITDWCILKIATHFYRKLLANLLLKDSN